MKKQRHIRTRLTFTLIGLTCAILLAVMLAFNIAVQSYIRSRVSTQLGEVTQSISEDRREGGHGPKGDKHFDEKPDRVTGAEYSAAVLTEDGSLKKVLYGNEATANELACYVRDHDLSAGIESKVVSMDNATYTISIQTDPVEADSLLLIYADVSSITAFPSG